jgi:chromosome segregation ATPase
MNEDKLDLILSELGEMKEKMNLMKPHLAENTQEAGVQLWAEIASINKKIAQIVDNQKSLIAQVSEHEIAIRNLSRIKTVQH